jgi:outer membrane assembly lipoprotein YfiO
MFQKTILYLILLNILACCKTGSYDREDPKSSFIHAKGFYEDENFDLAIKTLSAFIARFPYNSKVQESELMLADSYYEVGQYLEAAEAYKNFSLLYPKSQKRAHALYRVGEAYWQESPTAINRDQTPTKRACAAWRVFVSEYPKSPLSSKARKLILECEKRVSESMTFVAQYYCGQELWHSCAYKYEQIVDSFPKKNSLLKKSLWKAAEALEKMLQDKKEYDDNIYYRRMSKQDILNKIKQMRDKSISIKINS